MPEKKRVKELTIAIYEAQEGGYFYDIFTEDIIAQLQLGRDEGTLSDIDNRAADGGQCTTTLREALAMAVTATEAILQKQDEECPGCNTTIEGYPALSRYRHGKLCSDCGVREALEGDFIGNR